MLFSIEDARKILSRTPFLMGMMAVMGVSFFLSSMFELSAKQLLTTMAITGGIGFATGMYFMYRVQSGARPTFLYMTYFTFMFLVLLSGGIVGLPGRVLGRSDLSWIAFAVHIFLMLISLVAGMYREAKALGMLNSKSASAWRSSLEQYIDYGNGRIDPAVRASLRAPKPSKKMSWMSGMTGYTGALAVNIYWLFEFYGGGGNNAAYFIAPLMTGIFFYLNLTGIGPCLLRLLLICKLEREAGHNFVTTDFEKIQELRRTFFLSRWLMKDYGSIKAVLPVRRSTARSGERK